MDNLGQISYRERLDIKRYDNFIYCGLAIITGIILIGLIL